MKKQMEIKAIGHVEKRGPENIIQLDPAYRPALSAINGFSHLQILWWGHLCDSPVMREKLDLGQLFRNGPENTGSFATRSPVRPNPIMVSIIRVSGLDQAKGTILTPFLDAEPGTPVLDIKPYMKMERVKECSVPHWCSDWPQWQEEAAVYDWSKVILEPGQRTRNTSST